MRFSSLYSTCCLVLFAAAATRAAEIPYDTQALENALSETKIFAPRPPHRASAFSLIRAPLLPLTTRNPLVAAALRAGKEIGWTSEMEDGSPLSSVRCADAPTLRSFVAKFTPQLVSIVKDKFPILGRLPIMGNDALKLRLAVGQASVVRRRIEATAGQASRSDTCVAEHGNPDVFRLRVHLGTRGSMLEANTTMVGFHAPSVQKGDVIMMGAGEGLVHLGFLRTCRLPIRASASSLSATYAYELDMSLSIAGVAGGGIPSAALALYRQIQRDNAELGRAAVGDGVHLSALGIGLLLKRRRAAAPALTAFETALRGFGIVGSCDHFLHRKGSFVDASLVGKKKEQQDVVRAFIVAMLTGKFPRESVSMALKNAANMMLILGRTSEGMSAFDLAIALYDPAWAGGERAKLAAAPAPPPPPPTDVLHDSGVALMRLGELQEAAKRLSKGLVVAHRAGARDMRMRLIQHLAAVNFLLARGRLSKAEPLALAQRFLAVAVQLATSADRQSELRDVGIIKMKKDAAMAPLATVAKVCAAFVSSVSAKDLLRHVQVKGEELYAADTSHAVVAGALLSVATDEQKVRNDAVALQIRAALVEMAIKQLEPIKEDIEAFLAGKAAGIAAARRELLNEILQAVRLQHERAVVARGELKDSAEKAAKVGRKIFETEWTAAAKTRDNATRAAQKARSAKHARGDNARAQTKEEAVDADGERKCEAALALRYFEVAVASEPVHATALVLAVLRARGKKKEKKSVTGSGDDAGMLLEAYQRFVAAADDHGNGGNSRTDTEGLALALERATARAESGGGGETCIV